MSEEIKEILDKLSNREQVTLIYGLRECQLKDIEHPFITKEEYIDKILDYITNLEEEIKKLKGQLEEKIYLYNKLSAESKYVINKQKEVLDKIKEYIKEEKEEYEKGKEDYKRIGIEDYTRGQLVAYKHIEELLEEIE